MILNPYHYKLKIISSPNKTIIQNFKNPKQFKPSQYQNDKIWAKASLTINNYKSLRKKEVTFQKSLQVILTPNLMVTLCARGLFRLGESATRDDFPLT